MGSCHDPSTACRKLRGTPVGMTARAWRKRRDTLGPSKLGASGMTEQEKANPRPRRTLRAWGTRCGALVCSKFPSRLRASGACGMTVWRLVGKGLTPEGVSYRRWDFFVGA